MYSAIPDPVTAIRPDAASVQEILGVLLQQKQDKPKQAPRSSIVKFLPTNFGNSKTIYLLNSK
jgi:hypothetical protein